MDQPAKRSPGRPRGFDREAALDRATEVFWREGYEAASVADLVRAMGVSPPSLYAAFGDKRRLFLEALRRYLPAEEAAAGIAAAPSSREAARALLEGGAARFTGEGTPPGCLVTRSAGAAGVAAEVAAAWGAVESALAARARRDRDEGRLPPDADPEALAGLALATLQGLAIRAREGAPRPFLMRIARSALAAWPRESPETGGTPPPAAHSP